MSEFLAMGGHGLYVWLAYGLSFAVLLGLGLRPIVVRRRIIAHARHRGSDEEGAGRA